MKWRELPQELGAAVGKQMQQWYVQLYGTAVVRAVIGSLPITQWDLQVTLFLKVLTAQGQEPGETV